MAPLKEKGDLAEMKVACDLMDRGWGIAVPWGENCDFDLIAYRGEELQRIQVKYTRARNDVLPRQVSLPISDEWPRPPEQALHRRDD